MEGWRKHATIANKLLAAGQTDHALSALLRAWASIGPDSKTLRLGLILNAKGLFERCFGFNPHYIISLLNDEERRRSMYAHALEWLHSGSERRYKEAGRHCELLLFGAHAFWIGAMLQSSKDASFRVIANINASPTLSSWAMSGLEDKSSAVAAAWKCRASSALTDLKDAPAGGRRLLVWEPFPFADTLRGVFLKELAACASAASADISPRWIKLMAVIVESRTLVESNYVGLFDRKRKKSGTSSFRIELETQRSATGYGNEHDEGDRDASCGFDLSHFNSLSPPTRAIRLDDLDDARMLSKPFAVWGVDLHDLRDLNKEDGPVEVTATSAGGDSSGDFSFASEAWSSAAVQVLASGRADAVVVWAETLFSPPLPQREEDDETTTRGNASGWSCAPHVAKKMTACTHLQPLHEWQTAHFLTVPKLSQRSTKTDGATEPNTFANNGKTVLGRKEEEEEEELFDVDVGVKVAAGERISVSGVMGDDGLRLTVKRADTQNSSSRSGDAVHHQAALSTTGTGGDARHAELDKERPTEILCTTQDSATKPLTLDYHCSMMNDGARNHAYDRAIVRAVERCIEQKRSRKVCHPQEQQQQQQPVQYEEGKTGNAQMTQKVESTETLVDSVSARGDTRCFVKGEPLPVRVLDIGSGSGLLGLMAARAVNATNGDESVLKSSSDLASPEVAVADVVCCEKEQLLANLSAEIIPVNGYREEVRIAATLSSNLTAEMLGWEEEQTQEKPEERPGRGGADVVVTEIFGDAALSESVLPSMRHAVDYLLKKQEKNEDGKVAVASVPAGFRVVAAMALAPEWLPQQAALKLESDLGSDSVRGCNSSDSSSALETADAPKPPFVWYGDALAAMAAHTEVPITPIAATTLRWVTPPAVLLEMDMLNPSLSGEKTVRMPTAVDSFDCAGSHRAVVLVHWFELQMDDETVLTTAPCSLPATEERKSNAHTPVVMRAKCWKQSALFLPDLQLRPVEVESHATGNAADKAPPSAAIPVHSCAGSCDVPGAFSVRARFHRDRLHFDVRAAK